MQMFIRSLAAFGKRAISLCCVIRRVQVGEAIRVSVTISPSLQEM